MIESSLGTFELVVNAGPGRQSASRSFAHARGELASRDLANRTVHVMMRTVGRDLRPSAPLICRR
jgi:hypothetical protein